MIKTEITIHHHGAGFYTHIKHRVLPITRESENFRFTSFIIFDKNPYMSDNHGPVLVGKRETRKYLEAIY